MSENIAIKIEKVSKSFNLPDLRAPLLRERFVNLFQPTAKVRFKALEDISLNIKKGEILGIIGQNGSGKSTLLKIMSGIYIPTSGKIKTSGDLVSFLELGIGFNPELSGYENIYLNGLILGMSRKEIDSKFSSIFEFSGIDERFLSAPIKTYSAGMQLRLSFSVAAHVDADIYVFDEIIAVGDAAFQEKSRKIFKQFIRDGKTIIVASHALKDIEKLVDNCLYLDRGQVMYYGKPKTAVLKYQDALGVERART